MRYSLDLMTAPIWCRACKTLILSGFSAGRKFTSTPVSLGQLDLKSKLIAAITKVWLNLEDAMVVRLFADVVPKGCPFRFPSDLPGKLVVDLQHYRGRKRVQADILDVRIHDLRHT